MLVKSLLFALCLLNLDIYDHTLNSLSGGTIELDQYRGKYLLIVNVASESPMASQLEELEVLYQSDTNLIIIGVPSNSFGNEPLQDSAACIDYYRNNKSLTFPITTMSNVSGTGIHELFSWLTQQATNEMMDCPVVSDYQKFLINKSGKLVGVFGGITKPSSTSIQQAIANN